MKTDAEILIPLDPPKPVEPAPVVIPPPTTAEKIGAAITAQASPVATLAVAADGSLRLTVALADGSRSVGKFIPEDLSTDLTRVLLCVQAQANGDVALSAEFLVLTDGQPSAGHTRLGRGLLSEAVAEGVAVKGFADALPLLTAWLAGRAGFTA